MGRLNKMARRQRTYMKGGYDEGGEKRMSER